MKWMIRRLLVVAVFGLLIGVGCSASVNARSVADADVSKSRTFYVQKNPKDKHDIDLMLRDELRKWGRKATNGPEGQAPAGTHVLVTYSDSWYWDLRMYLLELQVFFRDPQTKEVLASAVNRRTSLVSASPEYMVWEALVGIFAKAHPDEKPPPAPEGEGKSEDDDTSP